MRACAGVVSTQKPVPTRFYGGERQAGRGLCQGSTGAAWPGCHGRTKWPGSCRFPATPAPGDRTAAPCSRGTHPRSGCGRQPGPGHPPRQNQSQLAAHGEWGRQPSLSRALGSAPSERQRSTSAVVACSKNSLVFQSSQSGRAGAEAVGVVGAEGQPARSRGIAVSSARTPPAW